ncbi:MAG: hypothetical protein ACI8SK_000037 [Shewanella sp.]|jgi:hypothetical protein
MSTYSDNEFVTGKNGSIKDEARSTLNAWMVQGAQYIAGPLSKRDKERDFNEAALFLFNFQMLFVFA